MTTDALPEMRPQAACVVCQHLLVVQQVVPPPLGPEKRVARPLALLVMWFRVKTVLPCWREG